MKQRHILILVCLLGTGCAQDIQEIGREPQLAPIGAGTWNDQVAIIAPPSAQARPTTKGSIWQPAAASLFRDPRAMSQGDVLTVNIRIDDKASVDTKSNRSRTSSRDAKLKYGYDFTFPRGAATGDLNANIGVDGSTSTDGKGKTSRQENIEFRVAAIVTDVLPNGNLVISGSQEVRVNFELRVVTVAGVVRPRDINADNSISYEKIAEARISYGGRGRIQEVQQPAWGQQIVDRLSPL